MNKALVVFDMAGTTVQDGGNVNQAFRDAFAGEGITVNETDVDKVMGYRKIDAVATIIRQYSPDLGDAVTIINRVHEQFTRNMVRYYEHAADLSPAPFAEELFQLLQEKGIRVALNTGFTREITNAILNRLDWQDNPLIDKVICSDEVPEGRPHAYMITSIMEELGIKDPAQVVKVGDTEVDILEGRNAGCGIVVAVTTGAYTREQLAGYQPDHIIDSLQEFPALIS